MRVFLDTNVVCDWLLEREPWRTDAQIIARRIAEGRLECLIAATTVTNLFYIARKLVGREAALTLVRRCLASFEICPIDSWLLEHALTLPGPDFEDNVQTMAAFSAGSDCIVTRDAKGFPGAIVRVVPPNQFVAELQKVEP